MLAQNAGNAEIIATIVNRPTHVELAELKTATVSVSPNARARAMVSIVDSAITEVRNEDSA